MRTKLIIFRRWKLDDNGVARGHIFWMWHTADYWYYEE